jgi:hypothetical protein
MALHSNTSYFVILICLTPDDLTCQGKVLALNYNGLRMNFYIETYGCDHPHQELVYKKMCGIDH